MWPPGVSVPFFLVVSTLSEHQLWGSGVCGPALGPATQQMPFCTWHLCVSPFWIHSDCIRQEAKDRFLVTPWDSYTLILADYCQFGD